LVSLVLSSRLKDGSSVLQELLEHRVGLNSDVEQDAQHCDSVLHLSGLRECAISLLMMHHMQLKGVSVLTISCEWKSLESQSFFSPSVVYQMLRGPVEVHLIEDVSSGKATAAHRNRSRGRTNLD
jgi:hypothetical protein